MATIQYFPHLGEKRARMEGFLEKVRPRIDGTVVHDEVGRVSRHIKNLDAGLLLLHLPGQRGPVHPGHDDIRQQQVQRRGVTPAKDKGIRGISNVDHGKSVPG